MDIPFKNNDQSSVLVNVPSKMVSKKSFNISTVKDQVLINSNDVGILKRKDIFMRTLLYKKGYRISIKYVYSETCKKCDFTVPTFALIKDIYNNTIL